GPARRAGPAGTGGGPGMAMSRGSGGHAVSTPPASDTRALVISGVLAGIYFVVETAVGIR
ncbi:MAG: hypothetical protein AB1941_29710, partial [Gemmatimonadota bacterium]